MSKQKLYIEIIGSRFMRTAKTNTPLQLLNNDVHIIATSQQSVVTYHDFICFSMKSQGVNFLIHFFLIISIRHIHKFRYFVAS